jgi:6-pyruvoyltetrahydropterin/6-carboxytetrahydropterin synthase
MVKQLKGEYKVKNEGLKPLFLEARGLISRFDAVEFVHIPREENEQADSLANDAMDERGEVGSPVLPYQAPSSLFDFTEEESLEEIPANFMCDADEGEESDKPAFDESSENSPLKLSQTQDFSKGSEPVGIYTLTVKDHFDAAHYLYDYPGECRNLHGHTWDIEVSVESTQLCELGMVYDFALLKKDLKAVLARYDHKYLNEIEPFDNISPTAENLARIIFEELSAVITQEGVFVTEVAVWESPIAKLVYKLR